MDAFWHQRRVFVTGATGMVGGWLIKALVKRGACVIALTRGTSPEVASMHDGVIHKCIQVHGSLNDAPLLSRTLEEHKPKTVFHLAGQSQVHTAVANPVGTLEANVQGTWNLLEACRHTGVTQVILASSAKAYGVSSELPKVESQPLLALSPYEVSKTCVELIARMYVATYGLQICMMRCGNTFGGGDMNFNRTIPGVIRSTCRGERFVLRSDGRDVHDYLYVEDAVQAYLRAARCLAVDPSLAGEVFNLSLGVQISVLQVVHSVLRLMKREDLAPVVARDPAQESSRLYLSSNKARLRLRWLPAFDMESGLDKTILWYRGYLGQTGLFHTAEAQSVPSSFRRQSL
jgi:CDP-glucose 4,6-dehydratase